MKSDNICPYWECWKWCDSLATIVAENRQRTHRDHGRARNRAYASRQRKGLWEKSLKIIETERQNKKKKSK